MAVKCIVRNEEFKAVAEALGSSLGANALISAWQDKNNTDKIPTVDEALKFDKDTKTAYNLKTKDFTEALYGNLVRLGILTKYHDNYYLVQSKDRVYNPSIRKHNWDRLIGFMKANNIPLKSINKEVKGKGMSISFNQDLFTPQDVLSKSRSFGTNHSTAIINHLKKLFPQIEIEVLSVKKAKELHDSLPKSQTSDVNFDNVKSFYINNRAILIKGRVTDDIAIEEILHPFVDGLYIDKKELFNNLFEESKTSFPELWLGIQDAYKDKKGFTEKHRQLELVAQSLSRYFNKEYKTNPTKTFKERVKEFIDWFFSIMKDLNKIFTGKKLKAGIRDLEYFQGDEALLEQEEREDRLDKEVKEGKTVDPYDIASSSIGASIALLSDQEMDNLIKSISEESGVRFDHPWQRQLSDRIHSAIFSGAPVAEINELIAEAENLTLNAPYLPEGLVFKNTGVTIIRNAKNLRNTVFDTNNYVIFKNSPKNNYREAKWDDFKNVKVKSSTVVDRIGIDSLHGGLPISIIDKLNDSTKTKTGRSISKFKSILLTGRKPKYSFAHNILPKSKPPLGYTLGAEGTAWMIEIGDIEGRWENNSRLYNMFNLSHSGERLTIDRPLGWIGGTIRTNEDGTKSLIVTEIQSDLLQRTNEFRDKGYGDIKSKVENTYKGWDYVFLATAIEEMTKKDPEITSIILPTTELYTKQIPGAKNIARLYDKLAEEFGFSTETSETGKSRVELEKELMDLQSEKMDLKTKISLNRIAGGNKWYKQEMAEVNNAIKTVQIQLNLHDEPSKYELAEELSDIVGAPRNSWTTLDIILDAHHTDDPILSKRLAKLQKASAKGLAEKEEDFIETFRDLEDIRPEMEASEINLEEWLKNTYLIQGIAGLERYAMKYGWHELESLIVRIEGLSTGKDVLPGFKNQHITEAGGESKGNIIFEKGSVNATGTDISYMYFRNDPNQKGVSIKGTEEEIYAVLAALEEQDVSRDEIPDSEQTDIRKQADKLKELLKVSRKIKGKVEKLGIAEGTVSGITEFEYFQEGEFVDVDRDAILKELILKVYSPHWNYDRLDLVEMLTDKITDITERRNEVLAILEARGELNAGDHLDFELDGGADFGLDYVRAVDIYETETDRGVNANAEASHAELKLLTNKRLTLKEIRDNINKEEKTVISKWTELGLKENKRIVPQQTEGYYDVYIKTYIKTFVKNMKESNPDLGSDFEMANDAIDFIGEERFIADYLNSENGVKYLESLKEWVETEFNKDRPIQLEDTADEEGGILVTPEGEEIEGEYEESELDKVVRESLEKKPDFLYSNVDTDYLLDELNKAIQSKDQQKQNVIKQILSEVQSKGNSDMRFMYDSNGTAMGLTYNGKIYLNENAANSTLVEEAAHLWIDKIKESNASLYKGGIDKVKDSVYVNEVLNNSFYVREALKQGDEGSKAFNDYIYEEALSKAIKDEGSKLSSDEIKSFLAWLSRLFDKLREVFGLENMTNEQVKKLTLSEFSQNALRDIFADKSSDVAKAVDEIVTTNIDQYGSRNAELTAENIPENATLSDIAKLLNTSDIEFKTEKAVDNKVRYNLTPEKQEVYEYALRQADAVQTEIIETLFHAGIHSPETVGSLAASTVEEGAPIIVLDESTHTYQDLNDQASVWKSTTEVIKGKMSKEKQEEHKLNIDLGNDFDAIIDGLCSDLSVEDIMKRMKILNNEQFSKAYYALQANLAILTSDGSIPIPQVVVYDQDTKIGGTIDILLVKPNGTLKIVDLKTSKNSIKEKLRGSGGTRYAKKSYDLEEDSALKQRGLADKLSTKQQHYLQVNLYKRMLENMGYTMAYGDDATSTMHVNVDVVGKGSKQKFRGTFKTEPWISHPESQDQPLVDALIPLNVNGDQKAKIDEVTAMSPESKAKLEGDDDPAGEKVNPEYDVITEALEKYRIGLIRRQEAIGLMKSAVFLGRHKSVHQLQESLGNAINAVTLAMSLGPKARSATYASLLRDAIRQIDEFQKYMEDPKNFGKSEYISYALNFDRFLATFQGLYAIKASKELNATQRRLAFTLQTRANEMVGTGNSENYTEGVIDKAITNYVRNIVRTKSNYNFSEEDLDQLMKTGKDIGVIKYQTQDLATTATLLNDGTPDTLLSIMDKIYKSKKQELFDEIDQNESLISNSAQKLLKLSNSNDPQKIYEFMLEFGEDGELNGRYVQEIGREYYKLQDKHRAKLFDDQGQPLRYRDVTDLQTADPADIEYNKRLALAKREFGDFFNAETIGPGDTYIKGEYHYYDQEFIDERKKYMFWVPQGRHGFWKRRNDVDEGKYARFEAKYYNTGIAQEGKDIMKYDKDGNPTGVILKDQIFPTVKNKYRKTRLDSASGQNMRSEKFIAIQEDKTALGLARKEFYDLFRTIYGGMLETLPKNQRDQMLGRVPLQRGRMLQDIKGKGNLFTKMYAKTSKGLNNLFRTTSQQRTIFVDEANNLVDTLPVFYTGRPIDDEQLTAIDEKIEALQQERTEGKIKHEPYKKQLAALQGERATLEAKPTKGELNRDMGNALLKFSAMALHYKTMSTVEDTMQAMLKVIEKREYQPEDAKITTGIKTKLGFEERGSVQGRDSNQYKRAKKWMKMVYYDNDQLTKGFADKVADGLIRFSSLSYVAFNPFGNFNNYVLGRVNDNIEAIGGRFYSMKAFARASAVYNKRAVPDMIHRLSSMKKNPLHKGDYDPELPSSKYEAFVDLYRMMDTYTDIRESGSDVDRVQKSWFSRALDWGYVMQDAAEWNVQTKVGIAMLMDTYIRNDDQNSDDYGEILSLYDAHSFDAETKSAKLRDGFKTIVRYNPENLDEDGKPKEMQELGEYNDEFRYDLRNKIREVNKQIHGNYAKEDRMVLQSSTVGKLAAQFHKWVAPAIRARFQREYFDENLGWMEGRYLGFWKFMSYASSQIAHGDMKFKNYKEGFLEDQGFMEGGDLLDNQRAMDKLFGYYRTLGEIGIMMLTFLLKELLMAAFAGDDDDNEYLRRLKNIAIYQADRTFKEMILFVPVLGSEQQYQMVKSPIASTRTMGELGQALMSTVITPWYFITQSGNEFKENSSVVYQKGTRAGRLKLSKEWQDAVPILYGIKKWENYLDMKNFYIK